MAAKVVLCFFRRGVVMTRIRIVFFLSAVAAMVPTVAAQSPGPLKAHAALVHALAISPDGKTLATGGFDNLIKLWEIGSDGSLKPMKELKGHTGPVYAVAFHPREPLLVSGSQDKTAKVWNLKDGKITAEFKSHSDIVDAVAFSPDGKFIASGSADKSVRLWNPADGKELKNLGTHTGSVYAVAFSPDGKVLASASADNTVKIWDVAGQKELKVLKGHEQPVTAVTFAGDADTVVTASMDRTIRVWSIQAVKDIQPPAKDKQDPKKDGKKDEKQDAKKDSKPDEKKDGKDGKASPKDAGELIRLGPTMDDPYAIGWSDKTKLLAVCGYSGQVTSWKLDDPKPRFTKPIKNPGYCIVFTADGQGVYTGHDNGTVVYTPLTSAK
jgi:WD40 repeat protein